VVKNGSKTCASTSAGHAGARVRNLRVTCPDPLGRTATRTSFFSASPAGIDCAALRTRFHEHLHEVLFARSTGGAGLIIADHPGAVTELVGDEAQRGVGDLGEVESAPALAVAAGEYFEAADDLRDAIGAALRFRHASELGHEGGLLRRFGKLLGEERQVGDHGRRGDC